MSFLQLPIELRLTIFEYILPAPAFLNLHFPACAGNHGLEFLLVPRQSWAKLLLVSQQIRAELTLHIPLYLPKRITLHIDNEYAVGGFLRWMKAIEYPLPLEYLTIKIYVATCGGDPYAYIDGILADRSEVKVYHVQIFSLDFL